MRRRRFGGTRDRNFLLLDANFSNLGKIELKAVDVGLRIGDNERMTVTITNNVWRESLFRDRRRFKLFLGTRYPVSPRFVLDHLLARAIAGRLVLDHPCREQLVAAPMDIVDIEPLQFHPAHRLGGVGQGNDFNVLRPEERLSKK